MKKNIFLFMIAVTLTNSCNEVLIEDYIVGTWKLSSYVRNDVIETSDINISYYEETYSLDGTFFRSYIDGKNLLVEETGKFSVNEDDLTMHLSDISSISSFSSDHSTLSTSTIEVVTIDDSEYVYSFENGGDSHEFRFIRKE